MSILNLLEVYNEDADNCHSIVLKHIPVDIEERELQEYVEKICKLEVKWACIPAKRCGVAIAILNDIVYDERIRKWQQRAFSDDFNGSYPTLELLYKPTGVIVNNLPDGVTDELLLLYFKGQSSDEEAVAGVVELEQVESSRYAIVQITDERDLASVLSKQSHTLLETEVQVGPYYPAAHRDILETLKSRETNKDEDISFMMNVLECQTGKDCFSKSEQRHNCSIEDSKHEEVSILRTRKEEDIMDSSDNEPIASTFTDSSRTNTDHLDHNASLEVYKKDGNTYERRNRMGQFWHYQEDMSEDEAPKKEMELSMQRNEEDVMDSSDDEPIASTFTDSSRTNTDHLDHNASLEVYKKDGNTYERRNRMGQFWHYQEDMCEDEALKKAMELSMQSLESSKNDDQTFKPVAFVGTDHYSDNETECTENGYIDESKIICSYKLPSETQEDNWKTQMPVKYNGYKINKSENKTRSLEISNVTVQLVLGAVAKQQADALVNVVSASRGLSEGAISKSFLEIGGEALSQMFEEAKGTASGDVVATPFPGNLRCKSVLHVKLHKTSENCQRVIRKAVSDVLEECRTWGFRTVAFPPIGVGRMFRFPPQQVAEAMLSEISQNLKRKKSQINKIIFAIYERGVFEIYDAEFGRYKKSHCITQAMDRHSPKNYKNFPENQTFSKVRQHSQSGARQKELAFSAQKNDRLYSSRERPTSAPAHTRERSSSRKSPCNLHDSYERGKPRSDTGKDRYILRGQKGHVKKENQFHKREPKAFVVCEPKVPDYWKNFKEGQTLKSLLLSAKHLITGKQFELVDVNKDSGAFCSIEKIIKETFDCSVVGKGQDASGLDAFAYKMLFVLKIERVENPHLFEQFTLKRQVLFRRLYASGLERYPKLEGRRVATKKFIKGSLDRDMHPEINEHLLFHGTKDTTVEAICNDGLDPRLSSRHAMFGSGIYASESATKADQYADDKDKRSAGQGSLKKMFLIRMVLGNSFLCTESNPFKFRRPPCTKCFRDDCTNSKHVRGKFGKLFDSVVGDNNKLFREFVVYDRDLCYPEYLITYERR